MLKKVLKWSGISLLTVVLVLAILPFLFKDKIKSKIIESINKNEAISNLDGLTLSTVWGLQRTYKRNFNLNLGLGVGYNFSPNEEVSGVVPVVNFTLGWVIGGK